MRHHLRHLGIQPLTHLGTAVVQLNAAVGIDMDQGSRLVEVLRGKGDTELDWCKRDTFFEYRAGLVELHD